MDYLITWLQIDRRMTCLLLEGSSGTGKTLLSSEAVKIKISQLESQDKSVRVIVTKYLRQPEDPLLNNFREHYFANVDVTILPMDKLCEDLGLKHDFKHPKDEMRQIIKSLSSSDHVTIFLCDELHACDKKGQVTADWTDLPTAPNVVWILSVRPEGWSDEMQNFRPPSGPGILSTKLVHGHRNCYQIRSVGILSFYISRYIKMEVGRRCSIGSRGITWRLHSTVAGCSSRHHPLGDTDQIVSVNRN